MLRNSWLETSAIPEIQVITRDSNPQPFISKTDTQQLSQIVVGSNLVAITRKVGVNNANQVLIRNPPSTVP